MDQIAIENAQIADRSERFYNINDVVFANHVICTTSDRGNTTIRAIHGQLGVVIDTYHPFYEVVFFNAGGGSVSCNWQDINPYQGQVAWR